ncbi:MAG: extracellular solute-binding protein [Clostridia bacterium]|nr:extracellular solute-binding protein [Clostridia bacterium]
MKRILVLAMALIMALSCVSFASAENDVVTITYFGNNAMAGSGELTGTLGKFFNDRGLNIEVVPYSTEKLQAQLASGDLADVIFLGQQEMQVAAESGLILPLDDYLEKMPNLMKHIDLFEASFNFAREYNSNGTGKLYYIGRVGPSAMNVGADTERHAIKLNWEVYAEAGYPEFSKLEDIIPVLQKMKEIRPQTADGVPTYGMHLFSDFDTAHFWNMMSIYSVTGKLDTWLSYGIEYDVLTQTGYSIFSEGSTYYRGLKFLYEMNKAGLIDPDSLSQTRSTAWTKIDSGAALAGWSGNPGWENRGYYPVVFEDFIPAFSSAQAFPTGGYCISANCKNVDAALKLLDTLCDEEALLTMVGGYPCDEGIWNYDENGVPTITKAYADAAKAGVELEIPADKKIEFWNIYYLINYGYITEYGTSYHYQYFPTWHELTYSTDLAKDWTAHYGYTYLKELLSDKNWKVANQTEGFTSFQTPDDDITILTKAALKDVIVPSSWRMVFAADEAEFEAIWAEMKSTCESLGINDLIQYKLDDIANAREAYAALSK